MLVSSTEVFPQNLSLSRSTRMDSAIVINWVSPRSFLGASGVIFIVLSNFSMQRHIFAYDPQKGRQMS